MSNKAEQTKVIRMGRGGTPYIRVPDHIDPEDAAVVDGRFCVSEKREGRNLIFRWGKDLDAIATLTAENEALKDQNTSLQNGYDAATAKAVRLQAIVDKLPKYADTGEAFVPGVDSAWFVCGSRAYPKIEKIDTAYLCEGSWFAIIDKEDNEYPGYYDTESWAFYSTREAAEAAQLKEQDDD